MIQILREITDWGDQQISNGDYYVNSHGYLIGYMPQGKAYKELRELFLGIPEKFPNDLKGRFDMITAAGILAQGHLDTKVFDEMIMACKGPGSIIIFTTR